MAFEFRTVTVATSATPNPATIRIPGSTITVSKREIIAVETPFVPAQKPFDGVEIDLMDVTRTVASLPEPTKTTEPIIVNKAIANPNDLNIVAEE